MSEQLKILDTRGSFPKSFVTKSHKYIINFNQSPMQELLNKGQEFFSNGQKLSEEIMQHLEKLKLFSGIKVSSPLNLDLSEYTKGYKAIKFMLEK